MIAVRLTPDMQTVIVGAPSNVAWHATPTTPQELVKHNCITLRLATSGGIYAWELEHEGKAQELQMRGQALFTTGYHVVNAAVSGCGLAFVTEDLAAPYLADGRLISVMPDWCPKFPGLHACYPRRRHSSRALGLVIETIRLQAWHMPATAREPTEPEKT